MAVSSISVEEQKEMTGKTAMPLLWIGITSIIMLFAGLTSAYVVRKGNGTWLLFDLPNTFYQSTGIIVLSSITMFLAQRAIKKDDLSKVMMWLGATLLLGAGFVFSQVMAWGDLVDAGVFFAGSASNASGSFLYALTGLHIAHLAGGIIALLITFFKSSRKKYSSNDHLGIQLCGTYWHFLGLLWIYLLLFLHFIR